MSNSSMKNQFVWKLLILVKKNDYTPNINRILNRKRSETRYPIVAPLQQIQQREIDFDKLCSTVPCIYSGKFDFCAFLRIIGNVSDDVIFWTCEHLFETSWIERIDRIPSKYPLHAHIGRREHAQDNHFLRFHAEIMNLLSCKFISRFLSII